MELVKFRIAVMSTVSTAAGFLAACGCVNRALLHTAIGTLLLACGSLSLNQYQERDVDARMPRTKGRPIPSGRISPLGGLLISGTLVVLGLIVLVSLAGVVPAFLGALAVVWYNGVYTPLKRRSAFAAVPGGLVGALPPAIGWTAAGGSVSDPGIIVLALFFFVWQVPHFWLLLLKFGWQYSKADLPSAVDVFGTGQLSRITFMWIAAAGISCLFLPVFGVVGLRVTAAVLVGCALWLIWGSIGLVYEITEEKFIRSAFVRINTYALVVVIAVSLDNIARCGKW